MSEWVGSIDGLIVVGKWEYPPKKAVPVSLYAPQIWHWLFWDWMQASALRGYQLTAWAKAWSINGCYCCLCYRYSLLVDPQGQASRWIRTMEKIHDLWIIKFSDDGYMKVIESAIELGKPVLLENVTEELEAPLQQLLKKQLYYEGADNKLYE